MTGQGVLTRRATVLGSLALGAALPFARRARAQGAGTIRIGVLNDMSGNYRDVSGPTSVACVRQAVQDFGDHGFAVEVLTGDHQNKPDVGASIVRQWFDRDGVDVVVDVPTSSVALAVATVAREKDKAYLNTGAATTDLTGAQCTPNTVHWSYDTWMLATSTGGALAKRGGDTWYFITADYVFGQQLQRDTTAVVQKAGGRVLGASPYPFPSTTDFSSYLVQAQASGAKVVGLANAGDDTVNCVKQAHEFGLTANGTRLAALLGTINVVHGIGLEQASGLLLTESFYWDLNDRTRALTERLRPKTPNNMPNQEQAGCYGAVLHYLKAVADLGAAEAKRSGAAAVARMKAMPTDDDAFGRNRVREDGRFMMPAYLFEVKKPAESRGGWDLYRQVAETPAEEAAPPVTDCKLVHA